VAERQATGKQELPTAAPPRPQRMNSLNRALNPALNLFLDSVVCSRVKPRLRVGLRARLSPPAEMSAFREKAPYQPGSRAVRSCLMSVGRKWIWLTRMACVGISGIILWRLLHLVHPAAVANAFLGMRRGWFFAALILYGLLFIPAALRWHLVLKLSNAAVRYAVTFQYTLIGHFFYTVLFGAIGGDGAKTALYARRFGIEFPRLLATAPVDRFLGMGSSILFGLIVMVAGTPHLDLRMAWWWMAGTALAVVVCVMLIRPWRFEPYRQFIGSFARIWKVVFSHREVPLIGIACGIFAQVAISAVLVFSLLAVSSKPLPLWSMFWTFPAVVAISALPITLGGLGTRETAAVVLFGFYGVSSADAASAALLTFTVSLIWGIVGAALIPIKGLPLGRTNEASLAPATN
jgi:glycosyltransferase 2 family protein